MRELVETTEYVGWNECDSAHDIDCPVSGTTTWMLLIVIGVFVLGYLTRWMEE